MRTSFIIEAAYLNGDKSYISNSSPIIWTDNIEKAKRFALESDAEYDLKNEFSTIETTYFSTKIVAIYITEIKDDIVVIRRKQFI